MSLLFKDLIDQNIEEIKDTMMWQTYDLTEVEIPVVELLKDHSLTLLKNAYGYYRVEEEILPDVFEDVFVYFPILLQQLSITKLIDSMTVAQNDVNSDTLLRTESVESTIEEAGEVTLGSESDDVTTLGTQAKTTGTISVAGESEQEQSTEISNTSGIDPTGNHNVNLSHTMPEQSISGTTNNFPVDAQGTPILGTANVQAANESFNTTHGIESSESSTQDVSLQSSSSNVTTNDVTVANTGTTSRNVKNSGTDSSESTRTTEGTNTINETRTQTTTNKQYAYELKSILDTLRDSNAFLTWVNAFSWVMGIR